MLLPQVELFKMMLRNIPSEQSSSVNVADAIMSNLGPTLVK